MYMECWGGVQGSLWKGEIKQMSILGWRKVGLGTGGIKWWGGAQRYWEKYLEELASFQG